MNETNNPSSTAKNILSDILSIPSFLNTAQKNINNEIELGNFIFNFLAQIPFLQVEKQIIDDYGRFNIIAKTPGPVKLFLAGHMDTVPPQQGWDFPLFKGEIKENKLYGIGAYDMKGGIASILGALKNLQNIEGLMLFFYCGEEYDFSGMKFFVRNYQFADVKPELAIIAEPSENKIWNAHRGIIELKLKMFGQTGHARNAKEGKNAIDALYKTIDGLREEFNNFQHPVLRSPSLNLAHIKGGLNKNLKGGEPEIICQPNLIADYAEAYLDIRPTSTELNAAYIANFLKNFAAKKFGCLLTVEIISDFGPLFTNSQQLSRVEEAVKKNTAETDIYLDGSLKGYGDGQMLQEKFSIPTIYFGPKGGNAHKPNEWVDLDSLSQTQKVFEDIIQSYCSNT